MDGFDATRVVARVDNTIAGRYAARAGGIASWSRGGDRFVAAMDAGEHAVTVAPDRRGGPIGRRLVVGAGIILESDEEGARWEYDRLARFLWVVARA